MNRVSTGLQGADIVIDFLRLGDNVVWQVDSLEAYTFAVNRFVHQAVKDNRRLVYIHFGDHPRLVDESALRSAEADFQIYTLNAGVGFESFTSAVYRIITFEGRQVFYVFDCLSELQKNWCSDLMTGNFFQVTCPYLFELDTVAYFALYRSAHAQDTVARIREVTQVLLNLYTIDQQYYLHPLKVWERYSPVMFLPHLVTESGAECITDSASTAELFSTLQIQTKKLDYWDILFEEAKPYLDAPLSEQTPVKDRLLNLLIGKKSRIASLCQEYFTLKDLIEVEGREIGTGYIGGKSIGMLLARKILETRTPYICKDYLEMHDSYYIGSDVFYTYIVQNGCWHLRMEQKKKDKYFSAAPSLQERLMAGNFPTTIKEQIMLMLEYFGQSPIIVRSSSLQEDNFGNAFAGKYESVFCPNQGTPQERYNAFMEAVRIVYASTMNRDALEYRLNRGLAQKDEQMALLVQRVSGDYHGNYFFPHCAGVGNSSNLFVWDKNTDPSKGMLRLVFGMGTRAVDRVNTDYPRIIALDNPERTPLLTYGDEGKFSQHYVDVINLSENTFQTISLEEAAGLALKTNIRLFLEPDHALARQFRETGQKGRKIPYIASFSHLLRHTDFAKVMEDILTILSTVYDYPVDIEFTCNFKDKERYRINLLQCRPLQTRGLEKTIEFPKDLDKSHYYFTSAGNFMGGNVRLPVQYIVFVKIKPYLKLNDSQKYAIANQIGRLNHLLKNKHAILLGPGRWGTTTPSLGVPVRFTDLCNMDVLCEISYDSLGLMPELSYGSHFFQDIVESDIFYAALFQKDPKVYFNEAKILAKENVLENLLKDTKEEVIYSDVIHVADLGDDGGEIYSDILEQKLICTDKELS
ncbi:PEP/pyruvate-binding domain-containing protein [Clostridium sp. C105KSO13]|uniref:PEP/pyruvate-binding domain-containing protein n=1 Tax=Clostridium sp. C105KSO13 TaxID=1776045 RepID=UPI00074077BB|nr:PEP/pyruvate-binding domain-containing protein [Clostridium sp. C105KSO13]CUX25977.1 phosphoenolpyruvate synthase [Clostridium sp. C105KSO13]